MQNTCDCDKPLIAKLLQVYNVDVQGWYTINILLLYQQISYKPP